MLDLTHLTTEQTNAATTGLDAMLILEALEVMNQEDQKVALAIKPILPTIAQVVEVTIESFNQGGRLIYMGAGTSGRLGVLDAAECVPTFGVSPQQVVGLIAGGETAMLTAVEGAEDDADLGEQDLKDLNLTQRDVVIGIAASGRTPYVVGGLDYANQVGAKTVSFSCNQGAVISQHASLAIEVELGAEVLTGSTRLKAGSAQKMILNMISTLAMVGIGKVYNNLMVDVKPTNDKLVERSKRIIMAATECSYAQAEQYFELSQGQVKVAIVMILTGLDLSAATEKLRTAKGFIKQAL